MPQGGPLPLPYRWQTRIAQWKNSFAGLFGGNQPPRPRICPVCGSLVGINTSRCHECGTNLNFSLAALGKKLSGIIGTDAPVTTVMLIANVMMFGVTLVLTMQAGKAGGLSTMWGMGGEPHYRLGESLPFDYLRYFNEWWRLVTAMFLHGGLIHIGFNMMSLYQLGPAVEELYGSSRYLFLYVVTGAFGFLCSSYGNHTSVGASGALLGLVGVLLAVTSKRGGIFARQIRSQLITSTVILFAMGLFGGIAIDNWAHAGGLAAGFALGKIFADRPPANVNEKRIAAALGWLAGVAVIVCFVLMLLHFHDPTPWSQ
jgi:rhomboid protease GluP